MNTNSDSTILPDNAVNNDDGGETNIEIDKLVEYQKLKLATEQAKQGKRSGNTTSADTSPATPAFKLLRDSDLQELPPQRWIVKNIIPDAGIGTIFGDSGTFKSFVGLDLLAHVARGEQWFGNRVTRAPCVYVPLEGRGGIPKRVAAWCQAQMALSTRFSIDPDTKKFTFAVPDPLSTGIAFIMEPLNLRNDADRNKLVSTLLNASLAGGIILIDTLAQAGGGLDENSSEGMGELIRIMQELQRSLSGVTLAVHHSGKDASRGMRGHSSLRAALDFSLECQRLEGLSAQFTLDKVKDDADGKAFPFNMRRVGLDYDDDKDMVTSLVVDYAPESSLETQPISTGEAESVTEQEADDEQFVWEWTCREVEAGKFPSANSLQSQLDGMKEQRPKITQKRVREAIHRLRSKSRLVDALDNSPSGNKWMRAVDTPAILEKQG